MARSFGVPDAEPPGQFEHVPSGSRITVFWSKGQLHHKIEERGIMADYPIAYFVGAGNVGRSYLIDLNGHLFQSPASYYTKQRRWDVSPGYEQELVLDFNRPITSDCLFCHAGAGVAPEGPVPLHPLSCERCHGPAEAHLRRPVPGSIVNPARLPPRERDSVCEQCHLEGATVVLNPGKYWWDFRPGQRLEQVETLYVYRTASQQPATLAAVSQAEELGSSLCVRASGGKLWCGSCHDPHGEPPANRSAQIRQVCTGCHSTQELAHSHPATETDCVACHMPRRPASDIVHAAVTDHRLRKHPGSSLAAGPILLEAWSEPPPGLKQRNLGLAYFQIARQKQSSADFARAYDLLSHLPPAERDASVQAALGYLLLGSGRAPQAILLFEQAVTENPASSEYWLDLGVAQTAAGAAGSAVRSLKYSIERNPYDYRPYEALSRLYSSEGQPEQSAATLLEYLKLVPQSMTVRLSQIEKR